MIDGVEPRGAEYTSWMLSEVMPRVERAFRVKSGPENTAIGGASLGAVIALHIASERPDVFGKVLLESMPLIGSASGVMKHFEGRKSFPPVIYFAIGGQELGADPKNAEQNKQYADSAAKFRALANTKAADSGQKNVQIVLDNEGTHDEATWARRFPAALRMLFVKPAGGK
jgi:predicted alpha/beta superfamily hydrolase